MTLIFPPEQRLFSSVISGGALENDLLQKKKNVVLMSISGVLFLKETSVIPVISLQSSQKVPCSVWAPITMSAEAFLIARIILNALFSCQLIHLTILEWGTPICHLRGHQLPRICNSLGIANAGIVSQWSSLGWRLPGGIHERNITAYHLHLSQLNLQRRRGNPRGFKKRPHIGRLDSNPVQSQKTVVRVFPRMVGWCDVRRHLLRISIEPVEGFEHNMAQTMCGGTWQGP